MRNLPASPDSRESLARDIGAVSHLGQCRRFYKRSAMRLEWCSPPSRGLRTLHGPRAPFTIPLLADNWNWERHSAMSLAQPARPPSSTILVTMRPIATTTGLHVYRLDSYISVAIVKPNGEYFGNLCAIDARLAKVSEPRVVRMFEMFANLSAMQLDNEQHQWSTEALLTTDREIEARFCRDRGILMMQTRNNKEY